MVAYTHTNLHEAKLAVNRLWTPPGWNYPMCAVCGKPIRKAPHDHHLFVSTRWRPSRYDLRNLVPVHGPLEARCHESRVHAGETEAASMRLYMLLGEGNWIKGLGVVIRAIREWNYKFNIYIARKECFIE